MIKLDNVSKVYGTGTEALSDITLEIEKGELVFLIGETGSGKTTLLKLLIRDMLPTKGAITVGEFDVVKLPSNKLPHLRKKIGVVFQDLRMLMDRTVYENIALPLEVAGKPLVEVKKRVDELLLQVGILSHKEKFPIQLSGGELQRAAIARALALSPEIFLADEPTGNLDEKTAHEIIQVLADINKNGTTVVVATHDLGIVKKFAKRLIALDKGKIAADSKRPTHAEKTEDKKEEKAASAHGSSEPKEEKDTKENEKTEDNKEHEKAEHKAKE